MANELVKPESNGLNPSILLILILLFALAFYGLSQRSQQKEENTNTVAAGTFGKLQRGGFITGCLGTIKLAIDVEAYDVLHATGSERDSKLINQMQKSGRIVRMDNCTDAQLLSTENDRFHVRTLEKELLSGFVPTYWFKPDSASLDPK